MEAEYYSEISVPISKTSNYGLDGPGIESQ